MDKERLINYEGRYLDVGIWNNKEERKIFYHRGKLIGIYNDCIEMELDKGTTIFLSYNTILSVEVVG